MIPTAQRVLVVGNISLLGAGIESLLAGEPDLIVIGKVSDNKAELAGEIKRLQADVVILHEMGQTANPSDLLVLLEDYPGLRVVVISASDNLIYVYNKQRVLVAQTGDLIDAIRRSWS